MRTRTRGIQTAPDGCKTVNKQYKGRRIFGRLGDVSQAAAEEWLKEQQDKIDIQGRRSSERLFCDGAAQYLIDCRKKGVKSIADIAWHISLLLPVAGNLPIDQVHNGTFDDFKAERVEVDEVSPTTVNRTLEVARTILVRSARVWRDDAGKPWLATAPLIEMLDENRRKPYPISWEQQKALLAELPAHLVKPCLFAVNTGAREENVCGLRWEWERKIKELGRSVFVVPGTATKNSDPFVIVPNDVAMNVIDSCRGDHDEFVFVYTDEKKGLDPDRMDRLNSRAYRKARKRANLEQVRIHDLRHTYGSRLRDAGVSEEDRAVLMGHSTASMPSHYAAPTIKRLVELANSVQYTRDTLTLLRVVNG